MPCGSGPMTELPSLAMHPARGPYAAGLDRNSANYTALSPIAFLERAADTYPQRIAVIHGRLRYSYAQLRERSRRLASGLRSRGVQPGDTVAILAPNTPAMLEAHYGVPMAGAVLNALNTRLDAASIAFVLQHGEAKVLLADTEFAQVVREALAQLGRPILVVDIVDPMYPGADERLGNLDYD